MHRYASDLEPSGYEWSLKFHIKTARYSARKDPVFQTIQSWVLGIFRINEVKIQPVLINDKGGSNIH